MGEGHENSLLLSRASALVIFNDCLKIHNGSRFMFMVECLCGAR